jgi:hypothetical protein
MTAMSVLKAGGILLLATHVFQNGSVLEILVRNVLKDA